jgi:hypothetical protein
MAWRAMEKSNGVMEIFVTFWNGMTRHFFVILTLSIPAPVMARYYSRQRDQVSDMF